MGFAQGDEKMAKLEEVVKMWDKKYPDTPIEKRIYGRLITEKITEGSMYGRRDNEAVIRLSDDFAFEPWHNRTCYVFSFKYDANYKLTEIYIRFERRIIWHSNTESFYEFLKNLNEKLKGKNNGLELELSQGRINPNHIVLGMKLELNLPIEEICVYMKKFIDSTQTDICKFLAGKQKLEKKLNPSQRKILNKILKKHKVIDKEQRSKYEEIYLLAEDILELLPMKDKFEVSYYTPKSVATKLLIPKALNKRSEFKLYDTFGMNDPSEGILLLRYILGTENKSELSENIPFVACFSLEADSLNQFRLYGKEGDKEATGVGIMFKSSFFENHRLYRCVYMDSDNKEFIHISQSKKEERDKKEGEKLEELSKTITSMFDELKELCEELKEDNSKIDINKVLIDLLIKILYLVKDCAFEEERECRIVDLKDIKDESIEIEGNRLYIKTKKIANQHIDKIYFAPLTEGMEAFEIQSGIKCIRSRNPFRVKLQNSEKQNV